MQVKGAVQDSRKGGACAVPICQSIWTFFLDSDVGWLSRYMV